ncbi:hypothetical protein [Halorubrum lacusprofundi]|uniref:Uncharacterized protein n=1 Tax=Halorubrum lacusprofundi (strain ATCC 49239 / DSM 5036 / JCM 8891 / ACAM 34) TaxID=416348 RepID=B9LU75_HALLT|nr:hypothetical protein [Halorubrum lacusprofundi]ACM58269.1 conserved hypothetical protein [Halorubrum lacusprofundi ATCC 49239]MCG1006351.1 hypothetical protein [Halorubrum lacusprofundi]
MSEEPREGRGRAATTSGLTSVTRRRLLAGGAAVAVAGLAGCLGTRDGPVPEPRVTSDRIDDGWRLLDESESTVFEQSYGPVTVTALEHTRIYEYVSVAEALSEAFGASGSPVVFFATRIDIRPAIDSLPAGIGRDRLMTEVESAAVEAFRSQLNASGIENVEIVDQGTSTVETGHTATTWRLTGEFAFEGEIPTAGGSTADLGETVDIEARLGVWHDGTDVLVAGGAHPAEPLIETIDEALPNLIDAETAIGAVADAEAADALATESDTFDEEISALLISVE